MTQSFLSMTILIAALAWSGCQRENKAVNVAPKCDPKTDPKCQSDGNGVRPTSTPTPGKEEEEGRPSGTVPEGGDSKPLPSDPNTPGGGGGTTPPVDPNTPGGGTTPPTGPVTPGGGGATPDSNKPDESKPDPSKPDPSKPDDGKPDGGFTPGSSEGTVKDLGVKGSMNADGQIILKLDDPSKAKFSEFSVATSGSIIPFNGPPTSVQSIVIGTLNIDLHFKFKFEKSDCSATTSVSPGGSENTSTSSLTAIETRCK